MSGDVHVRFCESLRVRFLRATHLVMLCRTAAEARQALSWVQEWTAVNGLTLHPEKTRIVDATIGGGFDFLGYHFERGYRWPRAKSIKKMRATIGRQTRRSNGHALTVIIAGVNRTLRGWFEYFKHSHETTFNRQDSWVRMRLRSILRKRHGLAGRGRGADHQRWPNAYFATQGLFSLVTTHKGLCQSSRR
ncbi:MAG: hypothetical protein H0U60_04605 [Blastocatellia bacterium]|nr:hypothetical protein [Blastocatellia bacterium]